ncbi:MAG: hypothetical protein AAB300_04705 [Nitrospirota bacterium]
MKQIVTNIVGVVALMVFLVPTVYGDEMRAPGSESGRNPTALLLVEQGEQMMKHKNQMTGALASFDMAIGLDPDFSNAYIQASAAASQMGLTEKAASYLEALQSRKPNEIGIQALLSGLEAKRSQGDPTTHPFSSGFFEFGVAALLGLVFLFFVAGYELSGVSPRGLSTMRIEKPYLIYPLLKVIWQGTQRRLLSVHEKRHGAIQWQPKLHHGK